MVQRGGLLDEQPALDDGRRAGVGVVAVEVHPAAIDPPESALRADLREAAGPADTAPQAIQMKARIGPDLGVPVQDNRAVPTVAEPVVSVDRAAVQDQGVGGIDVFQAEIAVFVQRYRPRSQSLVRHEHVQLAGVDDGSAAVGVGHVADLQGAGPVLDQTARAGEQARQRQIAAILDPNGQIAP